MSRKKSKRRRRNPFEGLTTSPGAHELAKLVMRCERLRSQVRRFLLRHPVNCRCVLCRYLHQHGTATYSVERVLTSLHYSLHSARGWIEMDRPRTKRKPQGRREELTATVAS
jgi:hypothetical protein